MKYYKQYYDSDEVAETTHEEIYEILSQAYRIKAVDDIIEDSSESFKIRTQFTYYWKLDE